MWVKKDREIAMISITHVLAEIADLKLGKATHAYVMRNWKCGKSGVPLSTALIDMYAKCKNLAYARRVFDGILKQCNKHVRFAQTNQLVHYR